MKNIALTKGKWRFAYMKDDEVKAKGFEPLCLADFNGGETYAAKVPGCFEYNLYLIGKAPDPYFSDNIYGFRQYESYHQWYFTSFDSEFGHGVLRFDGIDTVVDIIVNGKIVGKADNMFIPHEYEADGLKSTGNELVVHIYPSAVEARKRYVPAMASALKYAYPSLGLRRSAAFYGWDIFPRMACGGIIRGVFLTEYKPEKLVEYYLYAAKVNEDFAEINLYYNFTANAPDLTDYKVTVSAKCGDSEFHYECVPWHNMETARFRVEKPKLWYPRGYGEAKIYETTIRLYKNDSVIDEKMLGFGIRAVRLDRTTLVTDDNAKFEFVVNGKKAFVLGTNWVPVDACHEDYDGRVRRALEMTTDLGCNAVRVWGGGLYETDEFYDYCDRHGIMVWQDFMMACGKYPETPEFVESIAGEVASAVKRLRNHCSIVLWAGDNECDIAHRWNGFERNPYEYSITREVLPRVLRDHDVLRPYLPSSPFIENAAAYAAPWLASEDHIWGPRDYFKGEFYRNSPAYFASETGYHGCPSPQSLAKFLRNPEKMFDGGAPTKEYLAHATSSGETADEPFAYRIKLMAEQVTTLFGEQTELNDFVRASQISQAEAVKYFIEKYRINRNTHGGIIWWNVVDGWPQVSDAVVDFYGVKKLAYHYIKRSQSPVCIMGDEADGKLKLYLVNDTSDEIELPYSVKEQYSGKTVLNGKAKCAPYRSEKIAEIELTSGEKNFYVFEWTRGGKTERNHFHSGIIALKLDKYLDAIEKIGFDEWEGF